VGEHRRKEEGEGKRGAERSGPMSSQNTTPSSPALSSSSALLALPCPGFCQLMQEVCQTTSKASSARQTEKHI
jgi:hypothetical protein